MYFRFKYLPSEGTKPKDFIFESITYAIEWVENSPSSCGMFQGPMSPSQQIILSKHIEQHPLWRILSNSEELKQET